MSLDPTRLPALNNLAATRAAQGHSDDDARIYHTAISHHPVAAEPQAQTKSRPSHRSTSVYSTSARPRLAMDPIALECILASTCEVIQANHTGELAWSYPRPARGLVVPRRALGKRWLVLQLVHPLADDGKSPICVFSSLRSLSPING